MAEVPAGILKQQAEAQAPGQKVAAPEAATTVAKGKKSPKSTGKTPAQSVYPNLATQGEGTP
jgi:hypothetical protein